ncbi:uncharacterized protein LOC119727161 [Patiria miniata]|uniref:Uncharacterized protein n=1 Tax=Patiria miniata TaxID=46514 RepID=A0A913ZU27_PATMI|nr:uncharacterized protein LOC119727161 [Patiria miniata]
MMAIMTRCCCFSTRKGAIAAGIFSLIYCAILGGCSVWSYVCISVYIFLYNMGFILYFYYVLFACYVILSIASVWLLVGISKDLPITLKLYIIFLMTMMLSEVIFWVVALATLGFAEACVILSFVIYLTCLPFHIVNVLCVISQYQGMIQRAGVQAINTTGPATQIQELKPHYPNTTTTTIHGLVPTSQPAPSVIVLKCHQPDRNHDSTHHPIHGKGFRQQGYV